MVKTLPTSELYFLITCCQTNPSKEDIHLISKMLSNIDIQDFTTLATSHGILPFVYKILKNLPSKTVPETLLSLLKAKYLRISQHNIFMSSELLRLLKLFKENNIEALSFKGPSLSTMLYGDITQRQYGDLDILIKKEERENVRALCENEGYIPYLSLSTMQEEIWYQYAKDMVFVHPEKKIYIETHWLLLDDDFPLQIDLREIWETSRNINMNGHKVKTFDTESLLIYLCIHGSKHLWERIAWVKDIDQMVHTQTLNWDKILNTVEKNGFSRMLFLGLYLAQDLFHTSLPLHVQDRLKQQKNLLKVSKYIFKSWEKPQNMFQNTQAMLQLFPTVKMKIIYLHKTILKPSYHEYSYLDLPKGFYWVYYFLRPYLLIKKYLFKP